MTPEEIAEQEAATAAAKVEADAKAKADADAKNLHNNRTEKEKAEYSLKMTAKRLKELGGDPDAILGVKVVIPGEEDDNAPVTVGQLKDMQRRDGQKKAIDLAEALEDETEREDVKKILSDTIKPSGNPETDLASARAIANVTKNARITEELARKGIANRTAPGGSGGSRPVDGVFEPTAEEATFMQPPYNLTQAQVLEARKKEEQA